MLSESLGTGHSRLTVIPARKGFGAEIQGVDLRTIDDDDFSNIYRAWLKHSVLLFRGQISTDDDLIAFSTKFGGLDLAPIQESGRRFVEGHPEIYVVSNVIKNGEPIGSLGAGEATWHTDMSYLEQPPKASILYALEVPPAGGNTYFCNMYHAYESLPEELKRRITGAGSTLSPPETGTGSTLSPPETGTGSTLSPPEKGMSLKHDGTYNSGGYLRQGVTA